MVSLKPGEKLDDLMRKGLHIIQAQNLPKFGLEGVLLANYPVVKDGWKVCDLCTGTGIVPLLLTTRAADLQITGVELSPELSDLARRSVELNKLVNNIEIITGDVLNLKLPEGCWDLVTVNPPYFGLDCGSVSPHVLKARARSQIGIGVLEVIRVAHTLLKIGGRLNLSYRAGGLPEVLSAFEEMNFGISRLRFVHHNSICKASSLLLEARKGVGTRMLVEPPLIIFQANGELTSEMNFVYFEGRALESRAD